MGGDGDVAEEEGVAIYAYNVSSDAYVSSDELVAGVDDEEEYLVDGRVDVV